MKESERLLHEQSAKAANGAVWRLLETRERTAQENRMMREAAYASAWHWRAAGTPLHEQRSAWLLSRVCG